MSKADEKRSVNFLRGVPSIEALSHLIPKAAEGYEKAIKAHGTDVLQYGHFTGFKPLREIIGGQYNVDPERVIIGNGGLEVISLFFKSLPKGSNIVIEETSYDRVVFDAQYGGHKLVGVPLTPEGLDLDQFQKAAGDMKIAAFYGIPFHQNPTGINYTEENRRGVEKICREHDIMCLWDVCYHDLRYDGKQNDTMEVTEWGPLYASSFTKTISPGTKCGYLIVPLHYVAHLSKIISNTRINPNLPTQAFIAEFIQNGSYDDYLKYLCELYEPRMAALNTGLKAHFTGAYPVEITGGFFAPLTLESIPADKEASFVEACKQAGVGVAPAWDAVAPNLLEEKRKKGLFVRLTFPAFEPEDVAYGISALRETVDHFS